VDYELAKQLKDAGFPQEHGIYKIRNVLVGDVSFRFEDDAVYVPTLEELVEACGDKFWSLERDLDPDEIWGAYPANEIGDGPRTFGSSPAEAVARLWFALNK
jgi:hypothetical protein